MGFLTPLIGLGIVVLVILGFMAYWLIMLSLIALGVLFIFLAVVFAYVSKDPYTGALCSLFASGLTIWIYIDRQKENNKS